MLKHANTIFPGDPVTVQRGNEKVASGSKGKVQDIDSDMHVARVTFDDGSTAFVDLSDISREEE